MIEIKMMYPSTQKNLNFQPKIKTLINWIKFRKINLLAKNINMILQLNQNSIKF
jgi:hypothetical protein